MTTEKSGSPPTPLPPHTRPAHDGRSGQGIESVIAHLRQWRMDRLVEPLRTADTLKRCIAGD